MDLCLGHFWAVYDSITPGMTKAAKVQALVEYVLRQSKVEKLLAEIQRVNRRRYAEYKDRIYQPVSEAGTPRLEGGNLAGPGAVNDENKDETAEARLRSSSSPNFLRPAMLRGQVDFGILSIRMDEFEAV